MRDNGQLLQVLELRKNIEGKEYYHPVKVFPNYPRKEIIDWFVGMDKSKGIDSYTHHITNVIHSHVNGRTTNNNLQSTLSMQKFIICNGMKFTIRRFTPDPLTELTGLQLVERFKEINPSTPTFNKKEEKPFPDDILSQRIYTEIWSRLTSSIKWNSSYMLKHLVQKNLEFDDCIQEIAIYLKNLLLWFEPKDFTGDKDKFSISYYLHNQVRARVTSMNKQHCSYSYDGVKYKKFTEQEITSEEQMEVIETLHSKEYKSEWDEKLEIDQFVKSLSEIERKIFKLAMEDAPIKDAIKEVGVSKGKYLKMVREVTSKAVSYSRR